MLRDTRLTARPMVFSRKYQDKSAGGGYLIGRGRSGVNIGDKKYHLENTMWRRIAGDWLKGRKERERERERGKETKVKKKVNKEEGERLFTINLYIYLSIYLSVYLSIY